MQDSGTSIVKPQYGPHSAPLPIGWTRALNRLLRHCRKMNMLLVCALDLKHECEILERAM